jgi:hypothetical protein
MAHYHEAEHDLDLAEWKWQENAGHCFESAAGTEAWEPERTEQRTEQSPDHGYPW